MQRCKCVVPRGNIFTGMLQELKRLGEIWIEGHDQISVGVGEHPHPQCGEAQNVSSMMLLQLLESRGPFWEAQVELEHRTLQCDTLQLPLLEPHLSSHYSWNCTSAPPKTSMFRLIASNHSAQIVIRSLKYIYKILNPNDPVQSRVAVGFRHIPGLLEPTWAIALCPAQDVVTAGHFNDPHATMKLL